MSAWCEAPGCDTLVGSSTTYCPEHVPTHERGRCPDCGKVGEFTYLSPLSRWCRNMACRAIAYTLDGNGRALR